MGRVPIHPLLVAAWPVLLLWAENASEVASGDALGVLAWMLAGALVGTALIAALLRDVRRGALVASAGLLLYALYGRIGLDMLAPVAGIAIVVVALVGLGVVAWRLRDRNLHGVTSVANVAALALVVVSLPAVVSAASTPAAGAPGPGSDGHDVAQASTAPTRDIFYIVLDRYPRQDTLASVFDFDNSAFLGALEAQGVQVADRSLANYPKTAHSLAASLNLDYLDRLEQSVPADQGDDWGPVYSLLSDHRLGDILTDAGYTYFHLGNWWSPTRTAESADVVLNYTTRSEFASVYDQTTMLPSVRHLVGADTELSTREVIRNHTLYGFDQLDRLAAQDPATPRFVFAHITLPHEPYVFAADGSYVTEEQAASRSRERNIVEQVRYGNLRVEALFEVLLDRPVDEQPIVVLQSDEGPHPNRLVGTEPAHSWLDAPVAQLREKLRILNAYHLPGVDVDVDDTITPVNSFRLILDTYLGTDFGQLEDRAYVFPHESQLYDFTDVTDRVRGATP